MAFHELSFRQRFATMGDEAEDVYESVRPMGATIRFGWRRPDGISFQKLPVTLRHKPDYYAQAGFLVEVMGMGKDGILKSLKVDKYEALKVWRKISSYLELDVAFFIWNSHTSQYVTLLWADMVKLVAKSKRSLGVQAFDDGNEYYPILWEWLEDVAAWVGAYGQES